MLLAIFPFFGSSQLAIYLLYILEFQFSNIQYFVVFYSIREEKQSQNEPGQLIGDDTFSKFITFVYTFYTKNLASVAIFQRNHP